MKFSADHGHRILAGGKRTHRLPAHTPSPDACPHQPGDLLTLQFPETALDSYGQPILDKDGEPKRVWAHDARLRITTVTVQKLEDIDHPAARLEGHPAGFGAFYDWWTLEHGDINPDQPVWVIAFQVEYADTTRYLAPATGYTSTPARAIDDLPVTATRYDERVWSELADRAKGTQWEANRREREQRPLHERVRAARAQAGLKGLDMRDEWRLLGHHLRRGDDVGARRALKKIEEAAWPKAA